VVLEAGVEVGVGAALKPASVSFKRFKIAPPLKSDNLRQLLQIHILYPGTAFVGVRVGLKSRRS
jgi:hypothetical protein